LNNLIKECLLAYLKALDPNSSEYPFFVKLICFASVILFTCGLFVIGMYPIILALGGHIEYFFLIAAYPIIGMCIVYFYNKYKINKDS